MWMIVIIVLLIIVYFLYSLKTSPIKYYDFGNPNSPIKACLIAGVHGNEPAGTVALNNLIKTGYFENRNIFIRVIPCVNEFGYKYGLRWCLDIWNPDINRCFGGTGNTISQNLLRLINEHDFDLILDFHEGWGYHSMPGEEESIGSTISPTRNAVKLGKEIVNNLNKTITDPEKKFTCLENTECEIPSALSCKLQDKNYILIETTGQRSIQPLKLRCNQIKNILDTVLKNKNIHGF